MSRGFAVCDDDGTIRMIYNESDFRALNRLLGKTDQEVEDMIKKIDELATNPTGVIKG